MTKLTKAIAVLGVVAGLGVAALPLTSYAETTPVVWSSTPDTNTPAGWGGAGTDAGPMWVAKPVGVQLKIEEGLQISTSNEDGKPVDMGQGATNKDEYTSAGFKVNVVANNTAGYVLSIKGSGSGTNKSSLYNDANDEIVALPSASYAALALNANKSVWGYGIGTLADGSDGSSDTEATTFRGVTDSYVSIKDAQSKATTSAGDDTLVTFGAKIADGQASGTYKGQVTFMATAGATAATPAE